jgi:hypothetical protein
MRFSSGYYSHFTGLAGTLCARRDRDRDRAGPGGCGPARDPEAVIVVAVSGWATVVKWVALNARAPELIELMKRRSFVLPRRMDNSLDGTLTR